jgi:hypothetical protein
MSYAEVQFSPQWAALNDRHSQDLGEARGRAARTGNSAAMLPAEAGCHIAHAKSLVVAKAYCIADAYTAFNEPTGAEADVELSTFFQVVLAARKSSFQAQTALYQMRTNSSTSQSAGLSMRFEREIASALSEGRAILNKQKVAMMNRPESAAVTKYAVDTSVFNWLADGLIKWEALPSDGGFAITHIQVDEINKTKDEERRARLYLAQASLHCKLLPTQVRPREDGRR